MTLKTWMGKTALAPALALLVAGCGSLGEGVEPVSAAILPQGGQSGEASTKAFTCLNKGLSYIVTFSNGSSGDFASRARFSSSNPDVVRVSNGDIAVPEQTGLFFQRGTLVPVMPGTATVSVQYLGFANQIEVTVKSPQSYTVKPAVADLAARSTLDLTASMMLDGVDTNVDAATSWAIVTPNTAIATIDSIGGLLTGVAAGSGLTARARIPGCSLTADATVEVITATGTLDNGKTQDLSNQVAFSSSDTSSLSFFGGSLNNLALAVKASTPVQVAASFANPAVTAPAISITPVAESLNTLTVSPATVDVLAGNGTPFKATGNYASGVTQDITRHVGWSVSDTSSASISSSFSTFISTFAGQASTAGFAAGKSVTVTASTNNAASQAITGTATLNIK